MAESFAYHRSLAPNLAVLLGLAIVETCVLHIIAIALWGWRVAIVLGLVDLSAVAALIGLLRDIRRHPVTIADGICAVRVGRLKTIDVPLSHISGMRATFSREEVKARGVANFAIANWPNVFVEIDPPILWRRRPIHGVAHKLDDPQGFAAALDAVKGGA